MNLKQFKEKWVGKRVDYDGYYGYQCVDIIKQYMKELYDEPLVYFYGTAYNAFVNYNNFFGFNKVVNDYTNIDQIPKAGDIIFYAPTRNNSAGHVAIVTYADKNGTRVLEQNGGRGSATGKGSDRIREINRTYSGVLGRFSAPEKETIDEDSKLLQRLIDDGYWNGKEGDGVTKRVALLMAKVKYM